MIIDLHCDLLLYLNGGPNRRAGDVEPRCGIPHLRQGDVKLQTLAVFTHTEKGSIKKGEEQVAIYSKLPFLYPKDFVFFNPAQDPHSTAISTLMAFENASGFCHEEEPLSDGLKRLNTFIKKAGKPLYISLTWNSENRFGGGAWTKIGLKPDGRRLLEELHRRRIAIDFSHASDALAYDILDFIEGNGLEIPLMASHSNSRAILSAPRNLPDEIAREIFQRGGVIGLMLCRQFIGETEEAILDHLAHWLELGGENHICLGADFYYEEDLPRHLRQADNSFFQGYQNAACYQKLMHFLQKELRLPSSTIDKITHQNANDFIRPLV